MFLREHCHDIMNYAEYPLHTEQVLLPYVVCGIGSSASQDRVCREQGMCVNQLMYTVSGCGRIKCGGKEYDLPVGTAVILPANVPHEYYPIGGAWAVNWVIFSGNGIEKILEYYGFDGTSPAALGSLSAIDEPFKRCSRVIRAKDRLCVQRAVPILCEMINEIYLCTQTTDTDGNEDSVLTPALNLIESRYNTAISLVELAKATGVGREYFCSLFRRKMGMRPFEYIAMVRIQEAKKLLAYTDIPIAEVGRQVGYSDKSYFGHVFRKYSGMSPTAFRGY